MKLFYEDLWNINKVEIAANYIISSFVWKREERKYLPTNFMKSHYPNTNSDNFNVKKLQASIAYFDTYNKVSNVVQSNSEIMKGIIYHDHLVAIPHFRVGSRLTTN